MLRLCLTEDQTKALREKANTLGDSFLSHCFSPVLIHVSASQCASSERNLEQTECGMRPPLPVAGIAFSLCALSEVLPNTVQNHLKISFV